jgi:hypothetical protein
MGLIFIEDIRDGYIRPSQGRINLINHITYKHEIPSGFKTNPNENFNSSTQLFGRITQRPRMGLIFIEDIRDVYIRPPWGRINLTYHISYKHGIPSGFKTNPNENFNSSTQLFGRITQRPRMGLIFIEDIRDGYIRPSRGRINLINHISYKHEIPSGFGPPK